MREIRVGEDMPETPSFQDNLAALDQCEHRSCSFRTRAADSTIHLSVMDETHREGGGQASVRSSAGGAEVQGEWHPHVIVKPTLTHRYHVGVERGGRRGQFYWCYGRSVPGLVVEGRFVHSR